MVCPLKAEGWGMWAAQLSLEGVNILFLYLFHDVNMFQTVGTMAALALQRSGWFKTMEALLSRKMQIFYKIGKKCQY